MIVEYGECIGECFKIDFLGDVGVIGGEGGGDPLDED